MHVFVTGASGFVGSAVVKELLAHGHTVLGLARSDESAAKLEAAGVQVHRGSITDLESLKAGAVQADGVIHLAFNHDFSRWSESCKEDGLVVEALGSALAGTDKPLVVSSGTAVASIGSAGAGSSLVTEDDRAQTAEQMPRAQSELSALNFADKGVRVSVVRLPPTVHGPGDYAFIPMVINVAREKGTAAYIGDGLNEWPAVHRDDAATVYRLALEKGAAGSVFHAVAETGVPFKDIAETIGAKLGIPVQSLDKEAAVDYFGWLSFFASLLAAASSDKTKASLGWVPQGCGLLEDLRNGSYM